MALTTQQQLNLIIYVYHSKPAVENNHHKTGVVSYSWLHYLLLALHRNNDFIKVPPN